MKIAYLYAGQGAQHAGMGQELYEKEAAFRKAFDAGDLDFDRKRICFEDPENQLIQTQFTQRMGGGITVADAFPGTTIPTLGFWVAVIFFIPLGFQFGVFLTESSVCQFGAARIGAGAFGFTWHTCPPSFEDV